MYALIDDTLGERWDGYLSEAQLRTVTVIYARAHPTHGLSVCIDGVVSQVRAERRED